MNSPTRLACQVLGLALALTTRAQADDVQRSAAQALFDEARLLMSEERYAEACPKLAESQRLDPASGTLLNLAVCHEREGKTASAWLDYTETLAMAAREGNTERQQLAHERVEAIAGELSRLRLILPARVPRGFWIRLDGVELGAAAWHTGVPVDRGKHRVMSGAPGMQLTSQAIEVTTPGTTFELRLPEPALEKKPLRPRAPAAPPSAPSSVLPWLLTGASFSLGIAGLGVGAYAGIRAGTVWEDRNQKCRGGCTRAAVDLGSEAKDLALASNIAFATGIAALGAGTYFMLTAPRSSPSEVQVSARVSQDAAGLVAGGSF